RGVGPAAGNDDVLDAGPGREHGEHLIHFEGAVADRVGELVQDEQPVGGGGQVPLDLLPAGLGRPLVVLGLGAQPGPALAHLVPGDAAALAAALVDGAERPQRGLLADLPLGALGELEHADGPAGRPGPQGQTEGGRGLALAVAGVNGQQRLGAALPGGEAVGGNRADLALWHQAASLARMRSASARAASSRPPGLAEVKPATVTSSAPRSRAISPARPRRTGPSSASTTTLDTPPLNIPASRRAEWRQRSRRISPAAASRPAASGVWPPTGSRLSRRVARSTDRVGGTTTVASRPRKVSRATRSRRR